MNVNYRQKIDLNFNSTIKSFYNTYDNRPAISNINNYNRSKTPIKYNRNNTSCSPLYQKVQVSPISNQNYFSSINRTPNLSKSTNLSRSGAFNKKRVLNEKDQNFTNIFERNIEKKLENKIIPAKIS